MARGGKPYGQMWHRVRAVRTMEDGGDIRRSTGIVALVHKSYVAARPCWWTSASVLCDKKTRLAAGREPDRQPRTEPFRACQNAIPRDKERQNWALRHTEHQIVMYMHGASTGSPVPRSRGRAASQMLVAGPAAARGGQKLN